MELFDPTYLRQELSSMILKIKQGKGGRELTI